MTGNRARRPRCTTALLVLWTTCCLPAMAAAQTIAAPVLKWSKGGCRDTYCRTGWYASPAVADLDGDSRPDVIWSDYRLVVVRGEDGTNKWVGALPANPGGGRTWPDPVVADIDSDGQLEIVAAHSGGYVSVTRANGNAQNGWPRRPVASGEFRGLAVGDMDADGDLEIVAASTLSENQWHVLDKTGVAHPGWPQVLQSAPGYVWGGYNQNVGLGDVDGDGKLELIGPNDTHYIDAFEDDGTQIRANAMYVTNGRTKLWSETGVHYDHAVDLRGYANCGVEHRPNFADSAPTIVDVDGDGTVEIIVVGNIYNCGTDPYTSLFHSPYILRADRTRWAAGGFDWTNLPVPSAGSAPLAEDYDSIETVMPNPVVADLDGDGRKEILYQSYDGRLHAYWLDKTEHGSWPYQVKKPGESFVRFGSPPAVVDLDHDGHAEVVFTTWTQKGKNAGGELLIVSSTGKIGRAHV